MTKYDKVPRLNPWEPWTPEISPKKTLDFLNFSKWRKLRLSKVYELYFSLEGARTSRGGDSHHQTVINPIKE